MWGSSHAHRTSGGPHRPGLSGVDVTARSCRSTEPDSQSKWLRELDAAFGVDAAGHPLNPRHQRRLIPVGRRRRGRCGCGRSHRPHRRDCVCNAGREPLGCPLLAATRLLCKSLCGILDGDLCRSDLSRHRSPEWDEHSPLSPLYAIAALDLPRQCLFPSGSGGHHHDPRAQWAILDERERVGDANPCGTDSGCKCFGGEPPRRIAREFQCQRAPVGDGHTSTQHARRTVRRRAQWELL